MIDTIVVVVPFAQPLRLLRCARVLRISRVARAGTYFARGAEEGRSLFRRESVNYVMAFIVVALALTACGNGTSDLPATSRSGVRGVVMYGPTCPVEIAGSPCPDRLWSGVVRAIALNGDTAGETTTEDQGTFQLDLPEGTYDVLAVVGGGGPPTAMPVRVIVTGGMYARVTLQVDSGIR